MVLRVWVREEELQGLLMIKSFKAVALGLSLLFATVSVCSAQDLQKGLAAAQKGDYASAMREFRHLAAQGNAIAQFMLGSMYAEGLGVTRDYKEAVRLYGLAAAQGDAHAQSNLGAMYDNGQGVTQDYKEAVRLYGLAAAKGYAPAQSNLGVMYEKGWGVTQDYKEALRLFGLSAAQGNADAQNNLGAINTKNKGGGLGRFLGKFIAFFLVLALASALTYIWRKFRAALNPAKPNNEEFASDPVVIQQILDVAKDKDQLEIKLNRPVDNEMHLRNNSYLIRHWRGQLSLAKSWWYGALVWIVSQTIFYLLVVAGTKSSDQSAFFFAFGLQFPIYVWLVVGNWRSAGKHRGSVFWANLVRILVIISIFLNMTLVLQELTHSVNDAIFIKMKPTILFSLFAALLLGSLTLKNVFIKPSWRTMAWQWALFFLTYAALNEFVWRFTSTATWVSFRVFSIIPFILFALLQYVQRYILAKK